MPTDTESKTRRDDPFNTWGFQLASRPYPVQIATLAVKLIQAIIRPEKLETAKDALVAIGISGITVHSVNGFGKQLGHREVYRGVEVEARFLAKVMLTMLVSDGMVSQVMTTLREAAMTGEIGDGKIIVLGVDDAMRIRTGETGEASLG